MQLDELRGLGKTRLEALRKAGICTLTDLLLTLPAGYQDTTSITPVAQVAPGSDVTVEGFVVNRPKAVRFRGKCTVHVRLRDDSCGRGGLDAVFFNQPWAAEQFHENDQVTLYGHIQPDKQGRLHLYNPTRVTEKGLTPVYRAIPSIPGKLMRDVMRQALTQLDDCCPETLPEGLRRRYALCERNFALRQAHFPDSRASLDIALRRMAFEEALTVQAAARILRGERTEGVRMAVPAGTAQRFWESLSFPPTGAQRRVLDEIIGDLNGSFAMGRMVQGDVGCGKTAVALGAMYAAALAGYQSALMAPTEILARQHLESAQRVLEPLGVRCGLLLGGMKAAEKREALAQTASGAWQAVIGTHALLSDAVRYQKLGLVITDEQHRFGVRQRRVLSDKGTETPNALVMSATPIPRSLSLVLYGDLDLSVVDEMPPGRTPVTTRIVPESKREGLYGFIRQEVAAGRQTYIVCPLVEENETLNVRSAQQTFAELSGGPLRGLRLGVTYSEQDPAEKDRTLTAFARGEMDVLVATTVIEVGVNVPNATVMVIENADRFGLSQLHQLRGRVGRGAEKSWCFLMAEKNERLGALCATNDGFEIARRDLALRGPGDFLGTRQHGEASLASLALAGNGKVLEETHRCLKELLTPVYADEWAAVRAQAARFLGKRMEQVAMN